MGAAITKLGKDGFDGVYAANDGMAGGVSTAMKKQGVKDVPLGGQDAELAGLQRIIKGDQTLTIYKAIKPQAETTAEIAVALLKGEKIDELTPKKVDSKSKKGVPAQLYDAKIVTKDNIKDTIVKDKVYKVSEICTAQFAEGLRGSRSEVTSGPRVRARPGGARNAIQEVQAAASAHRGRRLRTPTEDRSWPSGRRKPYWRCAGSPSGSVPSRRSPMSIWKYVPAR